MQTSEPEKRPVSEMVGAVLRILRQQAGNRLTVLGHARLHQLALADHLHEGQAGPVLVPAVHEDRRPWVCLKVPDSPQGPWVDASLGLLVDRRVEQQGAASIPGGHKADGYGARAPVTGVDRGEDGPSCVLQEAQRGVVEFRFSHLLSVDSRSMADSTVLPTRHIASTRIVAVRGTALEVRADRVVAEEPLEIRAAGPHQEPVAVAVTMRTPGDEDELAVGFLRTEGLIEGPEVRAVRFGDPGTMSAPDAVAIVQLDKPFDASRVAERHFVATASCGICGKASIDEVAVRADRIPDGPLVSRAVILSLPDRLRAAQHAFDATGGLHAAGLFAKDGALIAVREDVGRHNALDKLVGSQILARAMPLHDRIVMVSGRVSFEIVQKAAVAGVPILCAVSAPSSLAIEAAERLGVTLVGFLRGDGFNVYSHDARIDLDDLRSPGVRVPGPVRR